MNTTICLIGLGNMGWPMGGHLIEAGFTVIGIDADPERERAFATELGGTPIGAHGLADATAVITMLPTSAIVAEALLGEGSRVSDSIAKGTIVIDMSSSQPLDTRTLGTRLEARDIRLVDAPVSGGVTGAQAGTLTIMIGGADEDVEAVEHVLAPMSNRIFRAGGLGAGHALKALNNFVAASGFAAACEALLVAERYGLDPQVTLDVFNVSTAKNFSTDFTLPSAVLTNAFNTGFPLALMTKDVGIARDLRAGMGVDSVLTDRVHAVLSDALASLAPGVDHSAAIKHWSGDAAYRQKPTADA